MSGITTCLRFPGQVDADLTVNMVPFSRLHFLTPGFAPLGARQECRGPTVADLTQQVFDSKNLLVTCDPNIGNCFGAMALYRGHISSEKVEKEMRRVKNKKSSRFTEWLPSPQNLKTVVKLLFK